MRRFVYVYILVSEADAKKHYTGITNDLSGRLKEHNRVTAHIRQNTSRGVSKQRLHSHLKQSSRIWKIS